MFGLREGVINEIVNVISKYEGIDKDVVFGSRARGDYTKSMWYTLNL